MLEGPVSTKGRYPDIVCELLGDEEEPIQLQVYEEIWGPKGAAFSQWLPPESYHAEFLSIYSDHVSPCPTELPDSFQRRCFSAALITFLSHPAESALSTTPTPVGSVRPGSQGLCRITDPPPL